MACLVVVSIVLGGTGAFFQAGCWLLMAGLADWAQVYGRYGAEVSFFGGWLLVADDGLDRLGAGLLAVLAGRRLQAVHAEFAPSLASLGSTRSLRLRRQPFGLLIAW